MIIVTMIRVARAIPSVAAAMRLWVHRAYAKCAKRYPGAIASLLTVIDFLLIYAATITALICIGWLCESVQRDMSNQAAHCANVETEDVKER